MTDIEPRLITFEKPFAISLPDLVNAQQEVPIHNGNIPVGVRGKFNKVMPNLELASEAGRSILTLTLESSFGFYSCLDGQEVISQQTESLVLEDTDDWRNWQAWVQTEQPLTSTDVTLIKGGVSKYVYFAQGKVKFASSFDLGLAIKNTPRLP